MKKRQRRTNKASVSFGLLSDIEFYFSSIYGVDQIPNRPGWYCWIYLPQSPETLIPEFISPKFYNCSVTTLFGAEYAGKIMKEKYEVSSSMQKNEFNGLISTMVAFSPPLYIGISGDLSNRLSTHKRQLESFLDNPTKAEDIKADYDIDSFDESSYFAKRIGHHMKELGVSKDELFIKYVIAENGEYLREVEAVLNKTFLPTYGIR